MAEDANGTTAPEIQELTGSSKPGAAPRYNPKTAPRPKPQVRPRLNKHPLGLRNVSDELHVNDLAQRLVVLLKREPGLVRRLDMLRLHELLPDNQAVLEKVIHRTWRRIDRRTRRLAAMNAPTVRAAAHKAAALIETAVTDKRHADPFDALAISLAHDVGHLALEAACLPQHVGGNFAAYHRGILEALDAMNSAPSGTPDAELDVHMDRWGAIDRLAMMDRPRTMADAVAALAYARREFHQFHVEGIENIEGEVCQGDRLTLHLLDGAAAVLKRVVQEDVEHDEVRRSETRLATIADYADLDFEAWSESDFEPHNNQEWSKLANPNLVAARVAVTLCRKTKEQLVEIVRGMPDEGVGSAQWTEEMLTQARSFFEGYGSLMECGWTRLMSAGATLAREQGDPEAQRGFSKEQVPTTSPDRRAVAAYRQWLDMEQRLLGAEMYPEAGVDAVRFVPMNTASRDYHLPSGVGASWRDMPGPMSRAEAMCRVLGIDWTTDEARDEHSLPMAPEADTATEAA